MLLYALLVCSTFLPAESAPSLVCDGVHDDTAALQAQLDSGHLEVPPARTCMSQPLRITCNNTFISIPKGATLKAGKKWTDGISFLTASHIQNVSIVGKSGGGGGTIDGSGEQWWTGSNKTPNRPRLVDFDDVTNVLLDGFGLLNAAAWHAILSGRDYIVRHVTIRSPNYIRAPNTDGFDISATNVHVHDCNITNGDDSIVMKSPTQDVLVERCVVKQGNGLVVGTSSNAFFRNITFRNCTADGTTYGCHIKFKSNQSGSASGITFEDIRVINVSRYAIGINQNGQSQHQSQLQSQQNQSMDNHYQGQQQQLQTRDPELQSNVTINNIVFRNVVGKVKGYFDKQGSPKTGSAGHFQCNAGSTLACRNITVEGLNISASQGCSFENVYGQGSNNSPSSCTPPKQQLLA